MVFISKIQSFRKLLFHHTYYHRFQNFLFCNSVSRNRTRVSNYLKLSRFSNLSMQSNSQSEMNHALKYIFREEIQSDPLQLEELHRQHYWIPGAANIRPLPDQIQMKKEDLEEIHKNWHSMDDYLLFKIFGMEFTLSTDSNKFKAIIPASIDLNSLKRLLPNRYPYNNLQCYHYIMWYGTKSKPYGSEQITKDIEESLKLTVRPPHLATFQFVWYENPKMTCPEFYHVHVFWIPE